MGDIVKLFGSLNPPKVSDEIRALIEALGVEIDWVDLAKECVTCAVYDPDMHVQGDSPVPAGQKKHRIFDAEDHFVLCGERTEALILALRCEARELPRVRECPACDGTQTNYNAVTEAAGGHCKRCDGYGEIACVCPACVRANPPPEPAA